MNERSLRLVSQCVVIVGGLVSVCLMLMSGLRPPLFLIMIFIGWVMGPFVALAILLRMRRWPPRALRVLSLLGIALVVVSCVVYGAVLIRPPVSQPASPYVMTPALSWIAIVLTVVIAIVLSRKTEGRATGVTNGSDLN